MHSFEKYFILIIGDSVKKLNRKGYMTIEIILAAVVTFVIAFFLIDLTMKLSSITDDTYADTVLVTDKVLIVKNIKEILSNDICNHGNISDVNCSGNICNITMSDSTVVNLSVDGNVVEYSGGESYSKEIDSSLSDITLTSRNSNGYYLFKISGTNIFVDEDYDMNIFVYNGC